MTTPERSLSTHFDASVHAGMAGRAAAIVLATLFPAACAVPASPVAPPGASAGQAVVAAAGAVSTEVTTRSRPTDPVLDAATRAHPVAFLDRVGWGADTAQLSELARVGATRFIDEQLRPGADPPESSLPPGVAARIAALDISQPVESLVPPLIRERRALQRAKAAVGSGDANAGAALADAAGADAQAAATSRKELARQMHELTAQAIERELLLAVHSRDQLHERLAWFWANHFNVYRGTIVGPMLGDYMARVIEPHALGHFRDLLHATMFSPQMLVYLNNAQNARGHLNENYAREVMELHTLGVGSGYTQADVIGLAHVLTGLGVDLANRPVRVRPALRADVWHDGLVVFNPARHDPEPHVVLGTTLEGDDVGEIERVVSLLADHPATARHVSRELARYFVADDPPASLVDRMVTTWKRTDGDIAEVLRTMFTGPEFAASLAKPQFKDPMRYVLSGVRARDAHDDTVNMRPLMGMLAHLGEPLFGRQTPDGYPTASTAWNGPGQLTARFEVARQLGGRATPHEVPPALGEGAVYRASEAQLSAATGRALAQAGDAAAWNALWLSSPEFMNF